MENVPKENLVNRILTLLSGLCFVLPIHAQTYNIQELFGFPCSPFTCPDGQKPNAIMEASDGNFYGVANGGPVINGGTIFKITSSGQFTVLYTFPYNGTSDTYPNGEDPGSITEGSDGLLYGTANAGGTSGASSGALWRINKNGTGFQVLERYCTSCSSGSFPDYIVAGKDGNLYGTTSSGGIFPASGTCEGLGCGVIFRLTTSGVYTVLHAFNGTTETSYPLGITQATDGNFYGGTGAEGGGALFRITPSGTFTLLSGFTGGAYALAPLTQASNGLLYGYSHVISAGTIELFSLSLAGGFSNVAQITQPLYKQYGVGQILQATDGNLWSTAVAGGSGYGQVFAVTTNGNAVANIGFNGTDGSFPVNGVIQASNGTLYGVAAKNGKTSSGGYASGDIYTISGLPPR